MEENRKEVVTESYEDVKKLQDSIVENSSSFVRLGLKKLKGSNVTILNERKRIKEVIEENGVAQCDACSQEVTSIPSGFDSKSISTTTSQEAKRLIKEAKEGTFCHCCGSDVNVKTNLLDFKMAIALIEILKFYRHNPNANENEYYSKDEFFARYKGTEYESLFEGFEDLYKWDLIARRPTRPDKIVYDYTRFCITENGIKFAQREIGVPKTAYSYNKETHEFESDFVTIEDLLKEADLNYSDLIKAE